MINKRDIGKNYESIAADYLRKKNFVILDMNFQTRSAEIDIVARDKEYLVFVEVKYRKDLSHGDPLEAVTRTKQQRIRRASLFYMKVNGYNPEITSIRYDVIGIRGGEITHIEAAF